MPVDPRERAEEPELVARANRQLLGQALANLVDNAIKYAASGGAIEIQAQRGDDSIVLSVADRGPGIPEADRPRVLDRLVRLDASRAVPGTGLGLAFVAAVARFHGRALELHSNDPGLRVVVWLAPAATPAD